MKTLVIGDIHGCSRELHDLLDKAGLSSDAVLLFGKNRQRLFPDATIRCARFLGTDTARFLDQAEIDEYLPRAVESAVAFIERHTQQGGIIGGDEYAGCKQQAVFV